MIEAFQRIGTMLRAPASERSGLFQQVKTAPMCIKQEQPDRAPTEPITPDSRHANTADLLNGLAPAEQIELYKTLQSKLVSHSFFKFHEFKPLVS